jgi:chemotaxis protein histidine kinase CheA
MNKHLYRAAAAAGLLAVAYVASGYLRTPGEHPVALAMLLLIAAFYVMGVLELHRFQQATTGLQQALDGLGTAPDTLAPWLAQVPAPLRATVQQRISGDRVPLPGPALVPYLVGLLVLLGMLGTFLGMVVTIKGTGLALGQASDVQTLREALAEPVRGLGLAFGSSVAGVAASAMLGLMSALARRDRVAAGQALDLHTSTTLHGFSRAHLQAQQLAQQHAEQQAQQAQQALQAQQAQQALQAQQLAHQQSLQEAQQAAQQQAHDQAQQLAQQLARQHAQQQEQLPAVVQALVTPLVQQLQALAAQLGQQAQQAHEQQLSSQQRFHDHTTQAYGTLATQVGQALQHSLDEGARIAAATLQPALRATLAGLARENTALQQQAALAVQQQLDGFAQRFEAQSGSWLQTLGTLGSQLGAQLGQQGGAALQALEASQARQQAQVLAALQATAEGIAAQAQAQARGTVDEVARLVHVAAQAPQAAAEVVAQLRSQLHNSLVQDTALLEERSRIMDTLNTLLAAVQHTAVQQRGAIDQLVTGTATWLQDTGARFTQQMDRESARLEQLAAQVSGSAADVASLGEAFGAAVQHFGQSSGQVVAQLQGVQDALAKSSTRSDEQLAYYVAQARELIDLSLLSQKQVLDEVQRLARRPGAAPAAAQVASSEA